jgi:hypothetical protein
MMIQSFQRAVRPNHALPSIGGGPLRLQSACLVAAVPELGLFNLKSLPPFTQALGAALALACATTANAQTNTPAWTSLFNGTNLAGWTVRCQTQDQAKVFWTAQDGAIVCDSIGRQNHNYVWLMTDREFSDFEVRLKFQAYTNSPGNSGLQFRSRFDPAGSGWLDGPQVDIHPPAAMPWRTGFIYDETREEKRWIFPSLKDARMDPWFKPERCLFKYADDGDGWNELTLRCQGTHVRTVLNGLVVTDWDGAGVLDNAAHQRHRVGLQGHFALQLHTGDALRIRFKDLQVRGLQP